MINNSIITLDNGKRYVAELSYRGRDFVPVHSTARSSDSSYGFQVWCDDNGQAYSQIGFDCAPIIVVRNVKEISDVEASAWDDEVFGE